VGLNDFPIGKPANNGFELIHGKAENVQYMRAHPEMEDAF